MKSIEKLLELAVYNKDVDYKREEPKFIDNKWLLDTIIAEVEEVREEIKPNNRAYLEDELSDILWGWLNLVENLKREGLVGSHEAIFKRALKKYEERILPLKGTSEDHAIWREVKRKQKENLQREKLMEEDG